MDIKDFIKSDETVIEVVQRHWMSILPLMLAWLIAGFGVLTGFYYLGRYGGGGNLPIASGLLGLGAILVLLLVFAYVTLWIYQQNRIILTTKNLIQVTQNSLFSRSVSAFSLERLQDVSASCNGFLPSVFDYGEVVVETAGEEENFVFHWAPHPRELASRIMDSHKRAVAADNHGPTELS